MTKEQILEAVKKANATEEFEREMRFMRWYSVLRNTEYGKGILGMLEEEVYNSSFKSLDEYHTTRPADGLTWEICKDKCCPGDDLFFTLVAAATAQNLSYGKKTVDILDNGIKAEQMSVRINNLMGTGKYLPLISIIGSIYEMHDKKENDGIKVRTILEVLVNDEWKDSWKEKVISETTPSMLRLLNGYNLLIPSACPSKGIYI